MGRWGGHGGRTHRHDLLLAGVDDADLLVLAGGDEEAAVAVPAHVVDEVGVHILQHQQHLPRAHVPEDHQVVTAYGEPTGWTLSPHGSHPTLGRVTRDPLTGAEQDVAGSGVPRDDAHPLGVSLQRHHWLRDVAHGDVVGNLPHLGGGQRAGWGAAGITPWVSAKRLRASEPINLIVNPSSGCGEGGEGTTAAPTSWGASPALRVLVGTGRGAQPGHSPPPQLFLGAESPGRVYLAQTAASWREQPPPAQTHGTGAKNRPVTLRRRRRRGDAPHRSPSARHPPPARGPAPHHDGGVLGGTGDDVVVVGTPVDVQHGRRVPRHQWVVLVHPSRLQCRGAGMSPQQTGGALPGAPPHPPQAPAQPPHAALSQAGTRRGPRRWPELCTRLEGGN